MIKTILSKEGVKRALNSHNLDELNKIYVLEMYKEPGYNKIRGVFSPILNQALSTIERYLESNTVLFIRIDTSDEGMISNKENKEDKDEHECL